MRETKFGVNALILILLIASAIGFFFSVKMVDLSSRSAVNEFYPIDESEYAVRYSNLLPNGIYRGKHENTSVLVTEGDFGYDWGAALTGDTLIANEYKNTSLNVMLCDLVKIDLNTGKKEILRRNTVLRGRCASGELVCVSGLMMDINYPDTNYLCTFYELGNPDGKPGTALISYLDPATGETLYSVREEAFPEKIFEARYLDRTLEEVKG